MQVEPPTHSAAPFSPEPGGAPTRRYPKAPPPTRFTVERVLRTLFFLAVLVVVGLLLWYFVRLVVYLLIGVVLSYLMRPILYRVQSLGLGHIPAIMVTFVVVFGAISLLLTYLVPFIAGQLSEISHQISPDMIGALAESVEVRLGEFIPPVKDGTIRDGVTRVFDTLFQEDRLTRMVGSVLDTFTNIFYALIVIPFITFFFLKDGTKIRAAFLRLVPNRYFEVTLAIIEKIETNIGRYFRALLLQSFSIATLATILLYVVGLKYALAVGLFAGLANTIPYFGPLIGFIAGSVVGTAQTGDFSLVLNVLLAMGITQVADNIFFQPLIFSRAARAHPLVILFVVLMGAQLAGIVGMLVAIPFTTTVAVTVQQVFWSMRNYRILKAS